MALGTIAGGLPSKNNGIGYDPARKKVVAGGLGTPRTSMVGGVMDTLNARLTNQASGAVNAALAPKPNSLWMLGQGRAASPVPDKSMEKSMWGSLGLGTSPENKTMWGSLGLGALHTNQPAQPGAATTPGGTAPAQPAGFSYNAEADPVYQAALRRAEANAKTASGNAQAEMNRRGILNSTITGDRIAQIEQSEMGRVSDTILPQLEAQAYARYRDDINQKFQEDQLDLQKGQLTGYYLNDEMEAQYNAVTKAKQDYANAKTPEERIAAHQRAEEARKILSGMNADASLVGSNVTLDQAQASRSKFGVRTLEGARMDYDQSKDNPANQAQIISNKIDQLKLDNLPKEIKLQLDLLQQQVDSGKIDAKTAEHNLKELTDPNSTTNKVKALQLKMTQIDADNYSEETRLKLEQMRKTIEQIGAKPALTENEKRMQDIELKKAEIELKNLEDGKPDKPLLASDFMPLINDLPYLQDEKIDGETTGRKIVNDKEGLESYILSLGLSDAEAIKLYKAYGLPLPKGVTMGK